MRPSSKVSGHFLDSFLLNAVDKVRIKPPLNSVSTFSFVSKLLRLKQEQQFFAGSS